MSRVHSFPPVSRPDARILVLGSMPGIASLRAGQYYAHPRNAFWPLISAVLAEGPAPAPYKHRIDLLLRNRVALWDVLKTCTRTSSLDSDIDPVSMVTNDFAGFFRLHPDIRLVCFNGAKAETVYRRHVLPVLPQEKRRSEMVRLPSTSPAYAALPFNDKLAVWQAAIAGYLHS
ncbi:MAG: DNA-deoxyinosine glycosylase [Ectothiorhodospiraceae bacterium]|nr:DNA-deoxyinosine glycosylase [Ectothiorhodospiraceae bacterium]